MYLDKLSEICLVAIAEIGNDRLKEYVLSSLNKLKTKM